VVGKVAVVDQVVHILGVRETIDPQIEVIVPVEPTIDIERFGIVQIVIKSYNFLEKNRSVLDLKKRD
jgi:hypothetical protein